MIRQGYFIAAAILGISIFNVAKAHSTPIPCTYEIERPWSCLSPGTSDVVRETVRHPMASVGDPLRHRASSRHDPSRQRSRQVSPHLADLVPELAAKIAAIIDRCGSHLISGYRPHAVVAGTNRASLHSYYPSRAADISGNPSCIYVVLHGWVGGYSTDYARVRHVHVSLDTVGHREMGCRFAHGGHRRYAHHHHRKTARG